MYENKYLFMYKSTFMYERNKAIFVNVQYGIPSSGNELTEIKKLRFAVFCSKINVRLCMND